MKLVMISALLALVLAGCGKNSGSGKEGGVSSSTNLSELQTASPTDQPSLIAAYETHEVGLGAAFFAFYTGDRYATGVAMQMAPTVARVSSTIGFYKINGRSVERDGKKTTCPASHALAEQNPSAVIGVPGDDTILVTGGAFTLILKRYTGSTTAQSGGLIQWGCFDQAGVFSPHAWTDL